MADLPDYYTQTAISEAEAASFDGGLDANKSPTPVSRDIYYATDTKILYVCVADGTWININSLYLLLAGGTMTGDLAMGTNNITGLPHPGGSGHAARKSYVDGLHALCLLLTGGTMSGNIAMGTKKLTGLGAPTAQNDSLRYGQAEIRTNEIAAAAGILLTQLEDAVCSETEADNKIAAGDVDKVDGFEALDLVLKLTVALFIANAATGTFDTVPGNINDSNPVTSAGANVIDQYAEVDFVMLTAIKQWRQYGYAVNNGDGRWKIQYWDSAAWQDWETDIPTRTSADWSDWASPAVGAKPTRKIRLVCTTVDTGTPKSWIGELEVKY